MKKDSSDTTFEAAFSRLEKILEKLNAGSTPLDEALAYYEEADKLIAACSKKLTDAERKIEILIKKRNGEIATDEKGNPLTEPFGSSQEKGE